MIFHEKKLPKNLADIIKLYNFARRMLNDL